MVSLTFNVSIFVEHLHTGRKAIIDNGISMSHLEWDIYVENDKLT
jgi:hypothetical protein